MPTLRPRSLSENKPAASAITSSRDDELTERRHKRPSSPGWQRPSSSTFFRTCFCGLHDLPARESKAPPQAGHLMSCQPTCSSSFGGISAERAGQRQITIFALLPFNSMCLHAWRYRSHPWMRVRMNVSCSVDPYPSPWTAIDENGV
jgi:hypothetical protein